MLMRPLRRVEPSAFEQALVGVFSNIPYFAGATVKAIALDSKRTFDDVAAGASGLGFTVMTRGLICFGEPRDGEPCFMAVPGYKHDPNGGAQAIKRGTLRADGTLQWSDIGGGIDLCALTFAGGAFHAVYCAKSGYGPTRIDTSFDGKTWNS